MSLQNHRLKARFGSAKIGIVSGVGPLAGSDVLAKVFAYAASQYKAHEDHEYPDVVLLNHGIEGVGNVAEINDTFKYGIVGMIEQLDDWDCSIIGIACNTAHAFISDATIKSSTTLINLLDEVAKTASNNNVCYGLLSSLGTKQQKLYHHYLEKHNVDFVVTTDKQQLLVDQAIDKVMEHKATQAGALLQKVIKEMKSDGINHFIAGCTELPIALQGVMTNVEILDSNFILAKALVDSYFSNS